MTARLTAWWTATTVAAASAATAAEIPFTGPYASAAGLLAATGICLAGYALAPHTRKDGRP